MSISAWELLLGYTMVFYTYDVYLLLNYTNYGVFLCSPWGA